MGFRYHRGTHTVSSELRQFQPVTQAYRTDLTDHECMKCYAVGLRGRTTGGKD